MGYQYVAIRYEITERKRVERELQTMMTTIIYVQEEERKRLIREISWELCPSVLDDLGLVPAIRSFLTRFSDHYHIDVYFDCVLNRRLNISIELTIYRIIQEALTNIRKYAYVSQAIVTVREIEDVVRVMVEDEGEGFDMSMQFPGVGLFSMDERARSVGGELSISSSPGKGTKIILEVPLFSL